MEWLVYELAARAGITTRALRHYDRIGLLTPSRVGANGYRYYGPEAAARLQRILHMRRMGLGLPAIADVLADEVDQDAALRAHIAALEGERARIEEQIEAAQHSLECSRNGVDPCHDVLLEGFNDRYEDDVIERWGADAFRASNDWWHGKSLDQQVAWKKSTDALIADWVAAREAGAAPGSDRAQEVAARHVRWLSEIPGTPVFDGDRERSLAMIRGLGDMYVDDPRFSATYGGAEGAAFVREALYEFTRTRM